MDQRIEQLIEICIQSDGDPKLYETLYECFELNTKPYCVKSLQLLNDLIKSSFPNSKIFNYILKYIQFNKLIIDIDLDCLILIQWLQNILIKDWKLLIIVWKLSKIHPQLISKQFLRLLNHFPSNLNHFPSYILLKMIQNKDFKDCHFDFNSLMVYKIDQIVVNNKERYLGPIYVQVIQNSLYLYIDSMGILLEIDDFQYYQNTTEKYYKEVVLEINNFWCLFDKNDNLCNGTTTTTTTPSLISKNHILLCHQNLKTITLVSPFAENNKYRVSTSKTILKLNGNNLTPSQDSILITKYNEISPSNNITKYVKKQNPINRKIDSTYKKVNNSVTKYKDSKVVKPKVEKIPNNLKQNKKNKDKKNHNISGKNFKHLKQGHLDNFTPVITIESSQLNVQKDTVHPQSNKISIKEEKNSTLQKNNVIGDDSTTILANATTTTTNSTPLNLSKKTKLDNINYENNEEIIHIDNPALSNNEATTSSAVTLPYDFTNLLQKQIEHSVSSFAREFANKVNMINQEVKQTLIKPLLSKYTKKIEELQEEFQRDTDSVVINFQDMVTKLHLNQKDLFQFLENSRRTT